MLFRLVKALLVLLEVFRHVVHLGELLLRPEIQVGELAANFGFQLVMRVRCGGAAKRCATCRSLRLISMGLAHTFKNGLVLEHLPREVLAVLVYYPPLADPVVWAAPLMTGCGSFLHRDRPVAIRLEQVVVILWVVWAQGLLRRLQRASIGDVLARPGRKLDRNRSRVRLFTDL